MGTLAPIRSTAMSASPPNTSGPESQDGPSRLMAVFVARPVTVLMLFLTLVGTGVMAFQRIPLTFLPEGFILSESLTVFLPFPGAGPQEVHDQLTRPVEDTLRTIPGLSDITSFSSEGSARIQVTFGSDVDSNIAYGEVRDRIERIRGTLPPEMRRYQIWRFTDADLPVIWMGIQYDSEAEDPFGPIERIIRPRLEGVDGVAKVNTFGIVDEVIRIFVDFEKVKGYGIDLGQVIQQMQADNFTMPAGLIDDGGRTFAVRIDARYADLEEIRRYPVGNGRVMSDIAEVLSTRAYRDRVWRISGRASVGMSVNRESDENTIEVCTRLEQAIASLEQDPRLKDITINVFWSQKEDILLAVDSLQSSGLWGGIFAIFVLLFFLRDLRITLIAALAIPASLMAGMVALFFSGHTLNMVTLTGFTLAIGMLVDNAVVVIENIARKRAQGLTRLAAATEGVSEVGLAVITATLTSVVVFVPLMFMDGGKQVRMMMASVGLPITFSLLASLLVAVVFIPCFSARLMRDRDHKVDSRELSPMLVRRYRSALTWTLTHRFGATILLILAVMLAQMAGEAIPQAEDGSEDHNRVSVSAKTPSYFTLADANAAYSKVERWASEHKQEYGFDFFSVNFGRRTGSLNFYAADDLERDRKLALRDNIRDNLPDIPGLEMQVGWEQGQGQSDVRLVLSGPDFGVLAALSEDLTGRLSALTYDDGGESKPLFDNVKSEVDDGLDEVHIRIERELAGELGVTPETVRAMVAWGLSGQRLPDMQLGDREVPVILEYNKTEGESFGFLRNIGVPRDTGGTVPLASIASMDQSKSVGTLVRRNNRTSLSITAEPLVENVVLVSSVLSQLMQDFPLPEGYSWNEEGGRQDLEADLSALTDALFLSIALVYLLMAILLESVILPLAILFSIPLALMGVNIALFTFGYTLGPMVVVGMILLAGIVVNNAIVLLDRVQRLRQAGHDRMSSLVVGGGERLRPILMTALTTIFGLLPMAMPTFFPGGNEQSGYESMAVTVAGGLAFSTFFTLLAVPLFYTYFDDLGRALSALLPQRAPQRAPQRESQRSAGADGTELATPGR